MSVLNKLKLTDKTRSNMLTSPEQRARHKLAENIDIQIAGAKEINGDRFIYDPRSAVGTFLPITPE